MDQILKYAGSMKYNISFTFYICCFVIVLAPSTFDIKFLVIQLLMCLELYFEFRRVKFFSFYKLLLTCWLNQNCFFDIAEFATT